MSELYIEQLRSIGFHFDDNRLTGHSRTKLQHYIPTIGEARFHDYVYPFLPMLGKEVAVGTDNIIRLYRFDRKLRLLTLDAIERIEVCVKSHLEDALVEIHGDKWHTDANLLNGFAPELHQNIKNEIYRTHLMKRIRKNGGSYSDFPTGRVLDNVSYGRAEILLDKLPAHKKAEIAAFFKIKNPVLSSWIKATRDLRNTSAHHSRLWNRKISSKPKTPYFLVDKIGDTLPDFEQRYYGMAVVLHHMVSQIGRNSQWKLRLRRLVEENNVELIDIKEIMGFPYDWWETEFWK